MGEFLSQNYREMVGMVVGLGFILDGMYNLGIFKGRYHRHANPKRPYNFTDRAFRFSVGLFLLLGVLCSVATRP